MKPPFPYILLYSFMLLCQYFQRVEGMLNSESLAIARVPSMGILKKLWQIRATHLCGCFLGHLDITAVQDL